MNDRAEILERIIEPEAGGFSSEHAEYVLSLSFPAKLRKRYLKLSEKAQQGALSEDEKATLDEYLSTNAILMILKSKARTSLKR